jgi:hypothetical protein
MREAVKVVRLLQNNLDIGAVILLRFTPSANCSVPISLPALVVLAHHHCVL